MKRSLRLVLPSIAAIVVGIGLGVQAQQHTNLGYSDTPMLPGNKWHVHDGDRPQPKVVEPGTYSSQDTPGKPPSDAVVLFDGTNLDKWQNGDKPAKWKVENGYMEDVPGSGTLQTKETFGSCQLHVEFATPSVVVGNGQGRGNSGVFLMGLYEFQVLDSYNNPTYPDGQAASVYGQYPPLANASLPPGKWQVYDIVFNVPTFKDGKVDRPAYFTAFHNGVLVQNHVAVIGAGTHRQLPVYTPHGPKGPVALQDHGNPMRFRNIWIREIPEEAP